MPVAFSNASLRSNISSAPERNVLNAATLLLSVSSNASPRSIPSAVNCFNPFTKLGKSLTGVLSDLPNLLLESAKFNNMFLVAVAALDASKPAFDN